MLQLGENHRVIVSLGTAVFAYVEPRDQEHGLNEQELEWSRKFERTLRIVLHQHAMLSVLEPK